jgi:L-2-hydroxyglutarate oxidase LhgO
MISADFVVIGAGIIGLTIAREIKLTWPDASVLIVEKEANAGLHASGRNSGVLHAGFYYTPDSLKAQLTRDGNRKMKEFCHLYDLPVLNCGKVVVTSDETQLESLKLLYQRGVANQVELHWISADELRDIEPMAKTTEFAIYSPNTASIDPVLVTDAMVRECNRLGVKLNFNEIVLGATKTSKGVRVTSNKHIISTSMLVNAAGLYADKIAHSLGVGMQYQMQPFIGLYLKSTHNPPKLSTHVYPVPDLRNPFLGVHLTKMVDGSVKIGPTATPALWREQYSFTHLFSLQESIESLAGLCKLLIQPKSALRGSVIPELAKYSKALLVLKAKKLVPEVSRSEFDHWSRPGIRAQLVNTDSWTLVSDFLIETAPNSIHILNAVSPAFTSSIPFAQKVVERLKTEMQGQGNFS